MNTKVKKILFYGGIALLMAAVVVSLCCIIFIKPDSYLEFSCESSISISVGESATLNIKCKEDAVFSLSSNSEVIEIKENNTIVGVKKGSAQLKVTGRADKKIGSKSIVVNVNEDKDSNLTLDIPSKIDLFLLKDNKEIAYQNSVFDYRDFSVNVSYSWVISNPQVVEVVRGRIVAKQLGSAEIKFVNLYNKDDFKTVTVTVNPVLIKLNLLSREIILDSKTPSKLIEYTLFPSYYSEDAELSFTVEDETVATFENGCVYAKSAGQTSLKIFNGQRFLDELSIIVEGEDFEDAPNVDEENGYRLIIEALSGCTISANRILASTSRVCISVKVVDRLGQTVAGFKPKFVGINPTEVLGGYIFEASPNLSFSILAEDFNLELSFVLEVV